jgi:hypothetical protein
VDGYQKTNDSNWLYYDNTPISTYFPSTKRYLSTTTTDWLTAKNIAIGMDGNLVKVASSGTNATLVNTLRDFTPSWIGASRGIYDGNFSWVVDGSALTYTNWNAGEPNNAGWPAPTSIFSNNFQQNSNGSSVNRVETNYGKYLGRFGHDNGNDWDFAIGSRWGGGDLESNKGTKITFDFLRADSWDDETFRMGISRGDGVPEFIGSKIFNGRRSRRPSLINS